jgi:CDP-diacylglycerol--glycerol-3-phosphate 3-phosphatidyltransferase
MNLPNKLTVVRIILSPLFFFFFFLPEWFGGGELLSIILVVLVFAASELTDLLDGYFARKMNLVTDVGKVIDPFADVMSRLTYFFCFTMSNLMPAWIFLVLLYRELGITFLRMLLIRSGIAMAASIWGKAKAGTYALGGVLGLVYTVLFRLNPDMGGLAALKSVVLAVFVLGALSSVLSFLTYLRAASKDLKA